MLRVLLTGTTFLLTGLLFAVEFRTNDFVDALLEADGGQNKPVFVQDPGGGTHNPEIKGGSGSIIIGLETSPQPDPEPPLTRHYEPDGLFALQPGKQGDNNADFPSGGRLISLAQLQDPDCAGLTIRFLPSQVTADGKWIEEGWQKIQNCINTVERADKVFTLLPMSGQYAINDKSIELYNAIDREVARRWLNNPRFAGYHVTGVTKEASEELHWQGGMSTANENYMVGRIKHARATLPGVRLIVALGGGDPEAMRRICREGRPDIAKNNNLMAFKPGNNTFQTWPNASHNRLLVEICRDPAIELGEELVGIMTTSRAGSNDINDALRQFVRLSKAAGEDPRLGYIAVYPDDLDNMRASVLSQ